VTSNTFCGSSNAAFHPNANDNGTGNPTRWERLFSPNVAIPADSDYVTLDFDVCTDTEFDPNFQVQAFDGLTLRIFDATPDHTAGSVLVEAYEGELTTGAVKHFPKHLPRNNNPAYLQDMSVWAGKSQGVPGRRRRTGLRRFRRQPGPAQRAGDGCPGPCGSQLVQGARRYSCNEDRSITERSSSCTGGS
jgi:hypothetical protein